MGDLPKLPGTIPPVPGVVQRLYDASFNPIHPVKAPRVSLPPHSELSTPPDDAVIDAMPIPLAIVDASGRVRSVNRSWNDLTVAVGIGRGAAAVGREYGALFRDLTGQDGGEADAVEAGVAAILRGDLEEFYWEDPRTAPEAARHFAVRVTRFQREGTRRALVVHEDITQRKRVESALRTSEARFRSLIENASDVISILDAEGMIRYESPSAARILGYPPSKRLNRSFFDFIHADDLARVMARISAVLERPQQKLGLEYRLRHGDGSWRILEGTARNLLEDPSVEGIVLNVREVTARKRAEEAQARLTAVMDATPSVVGITDPHGRFFYLNQAARRLIGLGPDADPSHLTLTELHPQWVNDLLLHEGIPAAVREGMWSGETALVSETGSEVPVLQTLLAHKMQGGGVDFFSMVAHDIRERKRTEEALRESHEIFLQIAENINETLWIFDMDRGEPVYVSPGFERIWGRSVESAYADPAAFLECIAPADRRRVNGPSHPRNGRGREEEYRVVRPDGTARWLRGRTFPIPDARGSICRIVGLTEDITDRKRTESELRQANRLEAIGHLAAGVAHEINTPIQYVGDNIRFLHDGFQDLTQLIARHQELLSEFREVPEFRGRVDDLRAQEEAVDLEYVLEEIPRAVAQSLEGVERVAEIVRAMKEFSHPGNSDRTPVDINRIIQSTLTVARNEWKYVAELVTDLDPSLPAVPCFPGEFNQALLNIIVNAAHAIADVVDEVQRGTLTIRTRRVDDEVEVQVQDTGSGIPEPVRARIFDPFFTTKEVGRGTGQGLTMAHSVVVDKHGGSLRFETEEGQGTTFFIRLPLMVADAPVEGAG